MVCIYLFSKFLTKLYHIDCIAVYDKEYAVNSPYIARLPDNEYLYFGSKEKVQVCTIGNMTIYDTVPHDDLATALKFKQEVANKMDEELFSKLNLHITYSEINTIVNILGLKTHAYVISNIEKLSKYELERKYYFTEKQEYISNLEQIKSSSIKSNNISRG